MRIRSGVYHLYLASTGRGGQLSFFKTLQQAEGASVSEIGLLQEQLLSQLLYHAYSAVPYYKRSIDELGGLEFLARTEPTVALSKLPLLTKRHIRESMDDLKSGDLEHRKWYYNTTGGSTGEPVKLIQDWEYFQKGQAVAMLFDSWTGTFVGLPKVLLWGSERDLLVGKETIKTRVGRYFRNECWLNTFRVTESDMLDYIQVINKIRPVHILAYVESIYELSRFIERKGLEVYSPRAIMTSAGTLYPHMRDVIERVFRTPVFNRYGSREVGAIACECEAHKGLHVSPLTHYVEIVREDGSPTAPGEVGEVVVTSLVNYAMPLVRYRIGDMAAWAENDCSCGRKWPLLKVVSGRINSIIKTKEGVSDSVAISTLLYFKDAKKTQPFESFSRYQLVQKTPDRFIFKVVVQDPKLWTHEMELILAKLRQALGENIIIKVEVVKEIKPTPSGKYVYILSELK